MFAAQCIGTWQEDARTQDEAIPFHAYKWMMFWFRSFLKIAEKLT